MTGSKIASADATRKLALNIKVAHAQAMKTWPTVYSIDSPKLLREWISELILLISTKNLFNYLPLRLSITVYQFYLYYFNKIEKNFIKKHFLTAFTLFDSTIRVLRFLDNYLFLLLFLKFQILWDHNCVQDRLLFHQEV